MLTQWVVLACMICLTISADSTEQKGLEVNIVYPADGTEIEHVPVIHIQYEVLNFDSITSPDKYAFCMSLETLGDDWCLPLPAMWPANDVYMPVIRDAIVGERVIYMHIVDPSNNTISVAKSSFYVTTPGKTKQETVDIFTITSSGIDDPNRKSMFDYVFENQAWGRRADVFKDHGNQEERSGKGLKFLEGINLKGGSYVIQDSDASNVSADKGEAKRSEFENVKQNPFDSKHMDADDYSRSGPGSTLSASFLIRSSLTELLNHYGITSMMDVPCGDLHWVTHVDFGATPLKRYVGADISTSLLAYNREKIKFMSTLVYMKTTYSTGEWNNAMTADVGNDLFGLFHDATAVTQYAEFVQTLDQVELQNIDLVSMSGREIFDAIGDVELLFNRHMMYHLSPRDNMLVLQHIQEYGQIVLLQRRMRCIDSFPSDANLLVKCDKRPFYFMSSSSLLKLEGNDEDYVLLLGER